MSPGRAVSLVVNGEKVSAHVEDHWTLLRLLREGLALTGTKEGCGMGECGACTVILNGNPVNSCLVLAVEVEGAEVKTIEGEGRCEGEGASHLSHLQQAFIDHGAFQCGFCTSGMIMSARALLTKNPDPAREEVVEAISGNLCRCTGYKPIVDAILDAAQREKSGAAKS